jgi:hypothetical protein
MHILSPEELGAVSGACADENTAAAAATIAASMLGAGIGSTLGGPLGAIVGAGVGSGAGLVVSQAMKPTSSRTDTGKYLNYSD